MEEEDGERRMKEEDEGRRMEEEDGERTTELKWRKRERRCPETLFWMTESPSDLFEI